MTTLSDHSRLWPKWYKPRRKPVDEVIAFVSREYEMSREMLLGSGPGSKKRDPVNARAVIAQVLKRRGVSSTVTARILGGRDHTTILHAWETWPVRVKYNPELEGILERAILYAGDMA